MREFEVRDRLFDILNETDNLPILDIVADEESQNIKLYLDDGSVIAVNCKKIGVWQVVRR